MANHQQCAIVISDRSSIGDARRISVRIADGAGLAEAEQGRVPLIVTELATNLCAHARGGEILLRSLPVESGSGIEIIALDRGPGMADVRRCMADGFSTTGTRGCGLGAVQRLSTEFDIYSAQPAGTVVAARVRSTAAEPRDKFPFSAISVPAPGEIECGDAWHVQRRGNRVRVLVADGLGHGPLAANAALEAIRVFNESSFESPLEYLKTAHLALRPSRGAAIAYR
jgi:anti-sigma regulatory factor (Ser/Thr protein kinase)